MCLRCDGYSEEEVERSGGLIAQWSHRYRRFPGAGEFLQVLPPKHLFCACHAERRRRLDAPPDGAAPQSA